MENTKSNSKPRNQRKFEHGYPQVSATPPEPENKHKKLNQFTDGEILKLANHLRENGQSTSDRFFQVTEIMHNRAK